MENNNRRQSRDQQRERWRQNARSRRQRMSSEQRQQELSRMRQRRNRNQMTDNNFASRRFQGTHDSEAGPSTTHINEIAHDSTDAEIPYVSTMATTNAAPCRNEGMIPIVCSKQLALRPDILECSLIIKERPANQPQYNLPTASQVAGIIVAGDMESIARGRDIKVVDHDGDITSIQETKGYYDPLQYPLLFPFGTYGWDIHTNNNRGRNVSCREYYSYMLQIRPNDQSTLLKAGRLLQQYVVDNYVKIESGRLRWIRTHQNDIRAEVYQGLQDALHVGEITTENIGRRTILPSSFIGSRRDMTQRYEDGMAIVLSDGKPDIFLTMTCNPCWSEITSELGTFETPQDRPDLLTRIFKAKFEQLKDDVINKGVLGKRDPQATRYLYKEIPEHYCWRKKEKEWSPRRSNNKVIGRIYTVSPTEGEKFYLRVLLSHLRGPTSWESLLTVNGTCFPTFKKAAEQWGFLESDNSIRECLVEASALRMPCALRRLFAIILIFCEPMIVRRLWDEFHNYMVEDYPSTSIGLGDNSTNMLLRDLNDLLNQHGKQIKDYDLPELTVDTGNLKFKDIFQLCQDMRTKHLDIYFDKQEDEFQKLWNIWKDEQSLASISTIDNKVHRLKVYSIGWGCTVITDKTQLWNMFFKRQELIDNVMYEELTRIISR
ncbi:Helitron helicase-like domain [Sesbania bispinosa]|nr:Helitron helicase-like domain [Sesbania bispinosa]